MCGIRLNLGMTFYYAKKLFSGYGDCTIQRIVTTGLYDTNEFSTEFLSELSVLWAFTQKYCTAYELKNIASLTYMQHGGISDAI